MSRQPTAGAGATTPAAGANPCPYLKAREAGEGEEVKGDRLFRLFRPDPPTRSTQRHAVRLRFLSACCVLGPARVRTLTIHHGLHTFVSHALAGGRSLAEVRAAAGHANVAVTSVYLHIVVDEEEAVGQLFRHDTLST
jgi:integrase